MIIMCAPTVRAWSSASLRLARALALELGEHLALEQPRRHVDLDVELPQLGLERRIGDRLERGRVDQRGSPASSVRLSSTSRPNERRSG